MSGADGRGTSSSWCIHLPPSCRIRACNLSTSRSRLSSSLVVNLSTPESAWSTRSRGEGPGAPVTPVEVFFPGGFFPEGLGDLVEPFDAGRDGRLDPFVEARGGRALVGEVPGEGDRFTLSVSVTLTVGRACCHDRSNLF